MSHCMAKLKKIRKTIRIDPAQNEKLKEISDQENESESFIVRESLNEYIRKKERRGKN